MMEYGNDSQHERYEEAPESLLRQKRRKLPAGRKLLLLLLAGGGMVIFIVLLVSFFTGGPEPGRDLQSRKTIHLGSAQDLPEPDAAPGRDLHMQAAVADMEAQINKNHRQVMEVVSALQEHAGKQTEYLEALVKQVQELTSRVEVMEKEVESSVKAMSDAMTVSRSPEKEQKSEPSPRVSEKRFYTVQEKDTLYSIARKNNIKLETLLKNNGLQEDSVIHPGEKLNVSP